MIGADGENHGELSTDEALAIAQRAGLDLVEISPNADLPVCKVLDYGKYKYEQQKKANAARKNQKVQDVKEIKMRPGIDVHDYQVKMKKVFQFLEKGDKVKVTMRFRGREITHPEIGRAILDSLLTQVDDLGTVESGPKLEGRQLMMVLAPLPKAQLSSSPTARP